MSSDPSGRTPLTLLLPTEHGPLHATLCLQPEAAAIVVAHAEAGAATEAEQLSLALWSQGFSTLCASLVTPQEAHFADAAHHVPTLSKRLLDFLGQLRHREQSGEIGPQRLGIVGIGATSPVAIRVAATRDHDIGALVCHGGLIDLAGMLYLRSLRAPLLLLINPGAPGLNAVAQRALREIPGETALQTLLPAERETPPDVPGSLAHHAAAWFGRFLAPPDAAKP